MGSPLGILGVLLVLVAVYSGIVFGLMWVTSLLDPRIAIGVGLCAVAYVGYSAVQAYLGCAAEPVFTPPVAGQQGEGAVSFACDGPGGMLSYGYVFVFSPLTLIVLVLSMTFLWRRKMFDV